LYTIDVCNKITNKGAPVCFFVTNREVKPALIIWLEWVKQCVVISPKRIMIDCSSIEIEAFRQAFSGNVDILLCHWYIKHAWKKRLKTDVGFDCLCI
jgi:hypothetical protein